MQIRPHSQRFRDFAVTVNFYCKYDVATSFRMEPIVLLLPAWPRWNQFINTKFTRPITRFRTLITTHTRQLRSVEATLQALSDNNIFGTMFKYGIPAS